MNMVKKLFVVLLVSASAVAWGASVYQTLKFGERVLGPIVQQTKLDAAKNPMLDDAGKPIMVPVQTFKWDGDFRWLTVAVDAEGGFNIKGAVCPIPDPANPEAESIERTCFDALLENQQPTAQELKVLEGWYKRLVKTKKGLRLGG